MVWNKLDEADLPTIENTGVKSDVKTWEVLVLHNNLHSYDGQNRNSYLVLSLVDANIYKSSLVHRIIILNLMFIVWSPQVLFLKI